MSQNVSRLPDLSSGRLRKAAYIIYILWEDGNYNLIPVVFKERETSSDRAMMLL